MDVLDQSAIEEMVVNHNINTIIHYSAILSAVGETNVPLALKVNGEGMQNVLEVAKYILTLSSSNEIIELFVKVGLDARHFIMYEDIFEYTQQLLESTT